MIEKRDDLDSDVFAEGWRVRWHDYLPAAALVGILVLVWLRHPRPRPIAWGVSAMALADGRFETILLHMFAHGSFFHLLMNSLGLLEIGGLVTARLGGLGAGWVRASLAYFLAGLSSMAFYLSFHPQGNVPMIERWALYGLRISLECGCSNNWNCIPAPPAIGAFRSQSTVFLCLEDRRGIGWHRGMWTGAHWALPSRPLRGSLGLLPIEQIEVNLSHRLRLLCNVRTKALKAAHGWMANRNIPHEHPSIRFGTSLGLLLDYELGRSFRLCGADQASTALLHLHNGADFRGLFVIESRY